MKIPRLVGLIGFALPWCVALFCAGWLVVLRYPPSGFFSVSTTLDGKSPWIFPFLPAERTTPPGLQPEGWTGQRILSDPTYFTARVPGPYDKVDVSFEFRSLRQPLIEFGMVRDLAGNDLEIRPVYSSELNASSWIPAVSGAAAGFVRDNVSPARLANADTRGLSVWDATATTPLIQDPPAPESSVAVSLRGSHDFYLVPTDRLQLLLTLQAANRQKGTDIVSIRVFRGDQELKRESFDVNGSADTRMGKTLDHEITIPDPVPGVYRISMTTNDDVFIRNIQTASKRWVVGPRLSFGDVSGYATTTMPGVAWTNSRHLVSETFHNEGLQTVSVGLQQTPVKATHTEVRIDRTDALPDPVEVRAPVGDISFIGDGYFSFTPGAFFEPSPRRFTSSTLLDKEHLDAVLTSYVRPQDLGDGWYRATQAFAIDPSSDQLRFVLSTPGALSRSAAVDIRNISLTYQRPAGTLADWMRTLRQEIANAWHRL